MPTGVYKRTNEYRKRLSEGLMGHFVSEETKEKLRKKLKGRALRGYGWHFSEEVKQKMSKIQKGKRTGKNSFNYGKHPTKEARQKMSTSKTGNKNPFYGKNLSEEHRRKLSEAGKGEKCHLWKGGITSINKIIRDGIESRLWREAVFARDNWTCQKYGTRGEKLHPHHIKNFAQYPELRFAIDNGITFSEKAHREFHKKYGIKNNTKEQLEEFLKK